MLHSRFVDVAVATRAVDLALPAIERALQDPSISGMGVLHLVVLDPAVRPAPERDVRMPVIYERSIGDRERWDVDYAAFARDKAALSWRHGMDSRRLQMLEPHRLAQGESRLWGGVCLDGIVVAASGALPIWDEAFALQVAGYVRSLAYIRAQPPAG
ncbi:hypothetical protein [Caldimonas sp. KR1-144]|uniref:hypothetical protein n=1 Tax=Caldimonas sp. KR1-144 TaxID=3400911 RepID=UPI003C00C06F